MRIHHRHLHARHFEGGEGAIDRGAQRDHSLVVRQRHLHHGHVAGQGTRTIHPLRLVEVRGQVIRVAGVPVGPHIRTHEEALVEEHARVLGAAVGGIPFRMEMMEMQVFEFRVLIGTVFKRRYKHLGDAGDAAQMDMVAGADRRDGLFGRTCLVSKHSGTFHFFHAKVRIFSFNSRIFMP